MQGKGVLYSSGFVSSQTIITVLGTLWSQAAHCLKIKMCNVSQSHLNCGVQNTTKIENNLRNGVKAMKVLFSRSRLEASAYLPLQQLDYERLSIVHNQQILSSSYQG